MTQKTTKKEIRRPSTRWSFYLRSAKETGYIRCVYCGCELDHRDVELDHVHPRAKGGTNNSTNVVVACRHCNRAKGDRPVSQFIADLAAHLAVAITDQAAPADCSDEEWEAGHAVIAGRLVTEIKARLRRERRRQLPRAAGRQAALLHRVVRPNRAA